jgi:hypothetical protein
MSRNLSILCLVKITWTAGRRVSYTEVTESLAGQAYIFEVSTLESDEDVL